MDPKRYTQVKEILLAARTLHGEARDRYLEKACEQDAGLRREVESLLPHDTTAPAILDEGALDERIEGALAAAPDGMVPPPLPDRIGPYDILGVLGEGGMGVVYEAEQTEPIRRRVALKLIRRGLDTDRVVARFESERQALARMDHPGIARVLDAGADTSGRPYFVMELVEGVPITSFCRGHDLDVSARIELFRRVCQAVQHAHRKGIIHRDLKPSNVLVARRDGRPVPKIIDFGIAKATDHSGTDEPALTQEGHLIGTPEYMSPEQADGSGNVDTRTDVYSLGVLLFEVLTGGEMPYHFDTHRYSEIQRVLNETAPRRPSEAIPDGPGADRARRRLSGDLDNITLMAMRREVDRRYGSVERMDDDLRRHLEGQPVAARKDTWTYRTGKFVRRNRTGVAAGAVIAVLLVMFALTWVRKSAEVVQERDRAVEAERVASQEAETARQVSDFLANLFELSSPSETQGNTVTAREILDRGAERVDEELADQPVVRGRLLYTLGSVYHGLGLYDRSEEILRRGLAVQRDVEPRHEDVGRSLELLATVLHDRGDYEQSIETGREGLSILEENLGSRNRDVALSQSSLAVSLQADGNLEEAEALFREAGDTFLELQGPEGEDYCWCRMSLGYLLHAKGEYDSAAVLYEDVLATQRRIFPQAHPDLAATINHLGNVRSSSDRVEEALALYQEALDMYRTLYPDGHAAIGLASHNLGVALRKLGRLEESEAATRESLEINRRILGDDHPYVAYGLSSLGTLFMAAARFDEAEPILREALAATRRTVGDDHHRTATVWAALGDALKNMGRLDEARDAWSRTLAIREKQLPPDHPSTRAARDSLATLANPE